MDEKDLKITALQQRIGEMAAEYEGKVADLRVVLTRQEQQNNELQQALVELQQAQQQDKAPKEDVVEGEIV